MMAIIEMMQVVVLKVKVRVTEMVTNEGQGEVVMVFNQGAGASDDDVDLWRRMFTRRCLQGYDGDLQPMKEDVYKMFTIWQPN